MNSDQQQHRAILQSIARQAMLDRGLLPDFSSEALTQLAQMKVAATGDPAARDLTALAWASIDNDDSLDLDQLTVAESLQDGTVKVLVAVADVDSLVKDGSPIDAHAQQNTTSVYTAAQIFPMLPEALSTGLTSLNFDQDRLSLVIEMVVDAGGSIGDSDVYRARVRNKAKLAYNSVASWLDGTGPEPQPIGAVEGLADNLRLQDKVAQAMKNLRHSQGALSLETIEAHPTFDGDALKDLVPDEPNRAKELIEDFMIGANGVTARYLSAKGSPSIRRVVRVPRRWDRIVELAAERQFTLPSQPDAKALETFLLQQKAADPVRFPDLSLSVIKLLGPGEYVAELPGEDVPGHFGLATRDYGHSTAPNRRYTDLITQRLLKAAIAGAAPPYTKDMLDGLATHCTDEEDAAKKVERQVEKSAAALLFQNRIGEEFDAIVTGASDKGTWVRLLAKPIEGKVVQGAGGLDVGDRCRVRLVSVDVQRGFIDFAHVG